jgi:hypothetical protein
MFAMLEKADLNLISFLYSGTMKITCLLQFFNCIETLNNHDSILNSNAMMTIIFCFKEGH